MDAACLARKVFSNLDLKFCSSEEQTDYIKTLDWLVTTPAITSYRTNTLKISPEELKTKLKEKLEKLAVERKCQPPEIYIPPGIQDTVIVGSWDSVATLDNEKKSVIVDGYCGMAVLRGANVFAPGVIGMRFDIQKGEAVNILADISGSFKKGAPVYECSDKAFIGIGVVKMDRKDLFAGNPDARGVAIEVISSASGVPSLDDTKDLQNISLLQNIPSINSVYVLDPQPGEIILDMCAAPGNKTTHIAAMMRNKGKIVALDKIARKIDIIKGKCSDFGIECVHAFFADSSKIVDPSATFQPTEGPPFPPETFDRILLDAPCSALGQRPRLINSLKTDRQLYSYVPLQRKLLQSAVQLLKPGGRLVYCTCTITAEENEEMVCWALRTFKDCLELAETVPKLGEYGWKHSSLSDDQKKLVQRYGFNAKYDSIGFFIACFQKKIKLT